MYPEIDFNTKKQLKQAIKDGKKVSVYQPGRFGLNTCNGIQCIEGPCYPKPHTWYAQVVVKDGYIVSVK